MSHPVEHLEAGRGAAGDDSGLAQEFPASDQAGVELLGELAETVVHGSSSSVGVSDGDAAMLPQPRAPGKNVWAACAIAAASMP